jgi:hypothetical protein
LGISHPGPADKLPPFLKEIGLSPRHVLGAVHDEMSTATRRRGTTAMAAGLESGKIEPMSASRKVGAISDKNNSLRGVNARSSPLMPANPFGGNRFFYTDSLIGSSALNPHNSASGAASWFVDKSHLPTMGLKKPVNLHF